MQSDKFKFISEKTVKRDKFELTPWTSAQLKSKLPKGIFWTQLADGGLIFWNWTLLQSYLFSDIEITEMLIEEYKLTIPRSQDLLE